jgi:O-antigen/teichoic acid export membrane protein
MDIYYSRTFITRKISLTIKGVLSHVRAVALLGVYMILTSIYSVLPVTLLGFLSTKSAVGFYYAANRIVRMVISVFASLVTVMIPRLNLNVENKESNEYLLMLNKTLVIVISFGIPITFFLFLLAEPIVMLLAGKNFIKSIFVLQTMVPIILIVAFAQVFVILILSVNRKDKEMVILSVIGMVVSVCINLIYIPEYAERATGASQLFSELLVTICSFFLAKKIINFHFPIKTFVMNVMCVIPFSFITYLAIHLIDSEILIIMFSGLACTIYFIFYQLIIIKDKFLVEFAEPYLIKLKKLWVLSA